MTTQAERKKKEDYEPPRIVHKGELKQFAGSPLGDTEGDSILGLPGEN